MAFAKLLLQVNWGAPGFLLSLIQAERNFFRLVFSSAPIVFPMYVVVLRWMKASMSGILHSMPLTSLFFICCSLTWFHFIPSICRMAPW
jgi:hypothetical protein